VFRLVIVVVYEEGVVMVPPVGPETLLQVFVEIDPSESLAEPAIVTEEVGRVMDWLGPALTVGGMLAAAETIILTSSAATPPELSVTVNLKTDVPCVSPVIVVVYEVLDVIVPEPEILVQTLETIVPSESVPDPAMVTEFVGKVIDWSGPALAIGRILDAALTVMVTEALPVAPPLSVTVSWKIDVPAVSPVTVVEADVGEVIVPEPEVLVQR
jgi:hypothetical protein